MKFVELTLGNMLVWHGFDADNKDIIEEVKDQAFSKKIVAVSRIQSVTEKYVLISSGAGRLIYWEYQDGYENVKLKLRNAGLFVD